MRTLWAVLLIAGIIAATTAVAADAPAPIPATPLPVPPAAQPAQVVIPPATSATATTSAASADATAAASQPAEQIVTITLINLNQIVASIVERDKECLTLKTTDGLMKLRINKVLRIEAGGTVPATTGTGGASGNASAPLAGPGNTVDDTAIGGDPNAKNAPAKPLSQMTPDERVKAAQKQMKAASQAVDNYHKAIQNHVGGVPAGQSPTAFNATRNNNNNNNNNQNPGQNPGSLSQTNWQPFQSDNPKNKATNGNQYQPNANGYNPNNTYNPYNPYNNNQISPSQLFYQSSPQNGVYTVQPYGR